MLVVGTDDPGSMHMMASGLQILEYNDTNRKWHKLQNILGIVHDPVHDVAFAPNPGRYVKCQRGELINHFVCVYRSYHMLAVASRDVHVIRLIPKE